MKVICIDARMISHGGIGTYIKNLLIQIKKSAFKLCIVIDPKILKTENWLKSYDLIFCDAPIYSIQEQFKLPQVIPSCDIFWSPHYNVPLTKIKAKKRLTTIHDVFHLAFFSSLGWKEKIYAKHVIARCIATSDKIITDSYFSEQELLKYTKVKKEKISVIHLGVDEQLFYPRSDSTLLTELRNKYQLPERFFLFVGNVKPHKNLKRLIQGFKNLLEKGTTDCSLVIIGKKEGLRTGDDVVPLVEKDLVLSKQVRFLGIVPEIELPLFYQLAIAFVLPSLYEGFGLPALEAMSCKCPVIASTAGSLPEICGKAAEYINPYDPNSIEHALQRILKDENRRKDLVDRGHEHQKSFRWGETAKKHIRILKEL